MRCDGDELQPVPLQQYIVKCVNPRVDSWMEKIPMLGVIFDFDGPIFDGRGASHKALTETFDQYEASVGRPTVAIDTLPLYEPSRLIALVYAEFPGAATRLPDICDFYRKKLGETERQTKVHDCVLKLLRDLKERRVNCAIVSSRPTLEVQKLIKNLGLREYFVEVWGSDKWPCKSNSATAINDLATKLDVKPTELVYIGDSDRSLKATKGTDVSYYHAAWTGEPSGRAYIECSALLRDMTDMAAALRVSDSPSLCPSTNIPENLVEAIRAGRLVFYAGAGVSEPSGIGGWKEHYLPILRKLQVGLWADTKELPRLLQMVAAESTRSEAVYNEFKRSFDSDKRPEPNSYHFAMIRSKASHIWTTNYDQLFESAMAHVSFSYNVIHDDMELLENFQQRRLILKMNGDFQHSAYHSYDLEWNLILLEEQFDLFERKRREIWRLFEDDYRTASIVFVGTSFDDPALRRLLSKAAKAAPRTRFKHHLLMKAARDPAGRIFDSMYCQNLKRLNIEPHLFNNFDEMMRWVQQLTIVARKPIIGFSGTGSQEKSVSPQDNQLQGGTINTAQICDVCRRLGEELAKRNFRVSAGIGPSVGVPAVEAAFQNDPKAARFYSPGRNNGYVSRAAPIVAEPSENFSFVRELDLLIAIGGDESSRDTSSTDMEINSALKRSIPVIIVKQGGGRAAKCKQEMMRTLAQSYPDPKLLRKVRAVNDELDEIKAEDLLDHVSGRLIDRIEDLIAVSLSIPAKRASDDQRIWEHTEVAPY